MFRSSGLARLLGTLAVAIATATVSIVSGDANPESRRDPLALQRAAAGKRAPSGTAVPADRYLSAAAQMESMPSYSTVNPSLDATATVIGTWSNLGPSNVGGRTRALIVQPGSPNTWYAGGVAGGVFKTTDAGLNWAPSTDTATPLVNLAVSSLVQKPGTPLTVWAGTGEGFFNGDFVRGAGIFQTLNGGTTWTQLTATNNANFYYVNDMVWAGATTTVYVATREGVFRTTNSGTTWTQILNPLLNGGCLDLALVATDTLVASCGTNTSAKIYRTTIASTAVDIGSWTAELQEGGMGRTSLAFESTIPNVVYAMSANLTSSALYAVFKSTDGGDNWTKVLDGTTPTVNTLILENAKSKLCSATTDAYGWYANTLAIDPSDPTGNTVWSGSIDVYRSTNGGVNWAPMSSWWEEGEPQFVPSGQHALVFGAGQMLVASDGGIQRMTTAPSGAGSFAACPGGDTISTAAFSTRNNGFAVTQFYAGAVNPDDLAYVGGTARGTLKGSDAAGQANWSRIESDFGGAVVVDPSDPAVIYVVNESGTVRKSTNGGTSFSPATTGLSGSFAEQAAFAMDPTNPSRLWIAGSQVFRSDNAAATWTAASDILGAGVKATAIAVSPSNPEAVLVGADNGVIYRTTAASSGTGSTVWLSVTPRSGYVSSIAFDPNNASIAYATYSTFGGIHLYKSTNGGATWLDADGAGATGIPDIPTNSVVVDPTNSARLYAATDAGVFVSINSGTAWAKENTGFLNVATERLVANGANLYAFTHGRGVWRVPFTAGAATTTVGFQALKTTVTEQGINVDVDVVLNTADHQPLAAPVTVNYASADIAGGALAGSDYLAVSGTVTFPAASVHGATQTISVLILEDVAGEPSEKFNLNLSGASGALLAAKTHTVVIDDDSDPAGFSISDASVTEGTAVTNATFTVSLFPAPTGSVTVSYATADGTATSAGDFTTKTGVLTFAAGQTSQTVVVALKVDTLAEGTETFNVNLSGSSGPAIADATGVGTITDNDVAGTLQFSAATYTVGETGPSATITVSRSGGAASGVTVQYQASNGSLPNPAVAPGDFTAVSGTVTFAAGVNSVTFPVPIINDTLDEADETVNLTLLNPGGGNGVSLGAQTTAVLTITDNDVAGNLAFSAATYAGNEGTTLTVTIKRAGGLASAVGVDYTITNGTATNPADYTATNGTVTFGASETSKTFSIVLVNDLPTVDDGETINLALSNPTGGGVLGLIPTAVVTVGDSSPRVQFSVASATVAETAASVTLTVNRTGPTGPSVTVPYTMTNGSATAGTDYTATSGNVVIAAGATSKTLVVALRVDTIVEGPENFTVTLGTPVGGTLGTNQTVTVNITDDDQGGQLSFSATTFSVQEPLTGTAVVKATVTVKRVNGKASAVTVPWSTSDGTAVAGVDYTAASGVLTFDANILSKTFTVDVFPDADVEGIQTINVALGTATGGATVILPSSAEITIVDSEPGVQFTPVVYTVGEAGPKATFTVKRTGVLTGALTVGIADLGTGTATLGAGNDYNNVPGSLAMPASASSKTFTIDILQDALLEVPETVNLRLTSCNPGCSVNAPAQDATLTINDDEPVVSFSVSPATVTEGVATVSLTLKRTGSTAAALTVGIGVSGGTATAGLDYGTVPATVVIPAAAATKAFTIPILNDTLAESQETILVDIISVSAPGFAGTTLQQAVVNINDNEPSIAFTIAAAAVAEPLNTTSTPVKHTIAVKRTGVLTQVSTVQYTITDGTAVAGVDYNPFTPPAMTGTLTFNSGVATVNIVVDILADLVDEPNKAFTITLSSPTAAKLGSIVNVTRTITDND